MKKARKTSKLVNFFVGMLGLAVIVIVYGFFTGGDGFGTLTGLFGFMAISIVCTGGVALVVWIPVLLLVGQILGIIILGIYRQINPTKKSTGYPADEASEEATKAASSRKETAIVEYIASCRNTGRMDDAVIRSNLKQSGWKDADIDSAFKKCIP